MADAPAPRPIPLPGSPPGLDLARLEAALERLRPGLVAGPLSADVVTGGRSNLTYVVDDGAHSWIVRRPPLGHVLHTAHDMAREFRVMTALAPTRVPVPRTEVLCEDVSVVGAPFYLMERVAGRVYRGADETAALGPQRARALTFALVETLAALHEVEPDQVGLGDFGRPGGYLERQVRRWVIQLRASYSRHIPGLEALADGVAATVPDSPSAAIVHGDYRLDNVIVGDGDRIAAVVDWEMSTLGDPLADVGLLAVYWDLERLPDGFPSATELLAAYARRRGIDVSRMDWYVAFGCYKLAGILEGVHYRYLKGHTVGPGFDSIGALVPPLVQRGLAALAGRHERP